VSQPAQSRVRDGGYLGIRRSSFQERSQSSRMMCAKCDGRRIAQHIAKWEILVSAAAARWAAEERSQAR